MCRLIKVPKDLSDYWERRYYQNLAWEASPNCYWCNTPTKSPSTRHYGEGGTLDHYYNKRHPRRSRFKKDICVNACAKCNSLRGFLYEKTTKPELVIKWKLQNVI